ncbi:MAG: tyrosine-type recombinase/integrase [Gammaproteobacteria bacterium]|nr:tyrosine-type recombinase/integrase [Gammaproteobacteria bacterium]
MLNDSKIKSLKPKEKRYFYWDKKNQGFGIRIHLTGSKKFVHRYQINGKRKLKIIGTYPALSLKEALGAYHSQRNLILQNIDPSNTFLHKKSLNVLELFDQFDQHFLTPRRRNPYEDRRLIQKDLFDEFADRSVEDISPLEAGKFFQSVAARAPVTANRLSSVTKQMFEWGIQQGLIETNPFQRIKRPGGQELPKERILSDDEIRIFWKEGLNGRNPSTWIGLKLLLVTAQRRGELVNAAWEDISFEERNWHIPQLNSKNKRSHDVPLSSVAISLLEQQKTLVKDSPFAFPSKNDLRKPMKPNSFTRALIRRNKSLGLEPFSVHDLRRTARTGFAKLKVRSDIAEMIINHSRGAMVDIYDRYTYEDEKREALEKWGSYLESLVLMNDLI